MMRTAIAKVMKQVSPREHQLFLGVPFYLFGYKRGCWVTAMDPRLQNLEFGYSDLAVTADCIHKCVIFQKQSSPFWDGSVFTFAWRSEAAASCRFDPAAREPWERATKPFHAMNRFALTAGE